MGNLFNKFRAVPAVVGSALVVAGASAHAALPDGVQTALDGLSGDAVAVAGIVLAAVIAVFAIKFIRKGL